MDIKMHNAILDDVMRFDKSMRVPVNVPSDEIDRITLNRLIQIRNADVNKNQNMSHFDNVIRFFLTDDEFQKYVIDNVEIKP